MWNNKTVSDLEGLKEDLLDNFPDAIRGSVADTSWDNRRKVLHLSYWVVSDDVGGMKVLAKGNMFYFIEWSAGGGEEYIFAESDYNIFLDRMKERVGIITRMVGSTIPQTPLPEKGTK